MKIKATRLVTQEAELPTPSWFKRLCYYYFVTEETVIKLGDDIATRWDKSPFSNAFDEYALEASTGSPITKEEFDAKYAEVVSSFDNVVYPQLAEHEEKVPVVTEAEKWAGVR